MFYVLSFNLNLNMSHKEHINAYMVGMFYDNPIRSVKFGRHIWICEFKSRPFQMLLTHFLTYITLMN